MGTLTDSYTTLEITPLLKQAINHVLSVKGADTELVEDLTHWSNGGHRTISFDLIKRIHTQLQHTPLGSEPVYLHDLLTGSAFCLPQYVAPPRDPELVARLESLRAKAHERDYQRMVKNVDRSSSLSTAANFGLEVSTVSQQLWAMVNFLLTVVGSFFFGYCAAYFADLDVTVCVFIGLGFGVVVFLADLYFLVRTPKAIEGKKLKTS